MSEVSDATNGKSLEDMVPAAKAAVESFVNAQGCKCHDDVLRALDALSAVSLNAVLTAKHGKSAVVQ